MTFEVASTVLWISLMANLIYPTRISKIRRPSQLALSWLRGRNITQGYVSTVYELVLANLNSSLVQNISRRLRLPNGRRIQTLRTSPVHSNILPSHPQASSHQSSLSRVMPRQVPRHHPAAPRPRAPRYLSHMQQPRALPPTQRCPPPGTATITPSHAATAAKSSRENIGRETLHDTYNRSMSKRMEAHIRVWPKDALVSSNDRMLG